MNTLCKVAITMAVVAWAAPVWAQMGEKIGIPSEEYRWKMSVAQVKAATPAARKIEDLGTFDGSRVLQISTLFREGGLALEPIPYYLHFWFKNDALHEFAMIPVGEKPDEFVGLQGSWSPFLDMVVFCEKEFGTPMQAAKLQGINHIQTSDAKSGQPTIAPLGFQIQHRTWQARGANYRIAHLFGYKLGLARMQGRLNLPFSSPLTTINAPAERAGRALNVFENFYIAEKYRAPMLANARYFQPPNPLRWGSSLVFMDFYWGMTPEEILAAAPERNIRPVESKKGRSLLLPLLVMESRSQLEWSLQMWFDSQGLSEFELRPRTDSPNGALLGVADGAAYDKELNRVVQQSYGIPAKQWWNQTQNATTRVKKKYSRTTWVTTPESQQGYAVLNPNGSYSYGSYTVPSSSYPVTRTYKYFTPFPVALPFTIKDRAWTIGKTKPEHYRQAYLFDSTSGARLGVVRLQGRRDKSFTTGTGDLVKTKDLKIVLREVYENYNVTLQ